jgi:hypothetical protein
MVIILYIILLFIYVYLINGSCAVEVAILMAVHMGVVCIDRPIEAVAPSYYLILIISNFKCFYNFSQNSSSFKY